MLPMVQPEPVIFNCGGHSVNGAAVPSVTVPQSLTSDSDVDELVDIFFDVDVAVNTFPRIESCDLQLGDTWRGMQGKMSVTTPVKKIRKKSDNKPQSQINKCHNEKKRRELENETINQLEELLGTCLAEVKQPDKNGIVREATRQIQEVLRRRRECSGECPLRIAQCLSPVQAGEVSSTQPQPPTSGLHYSEITTLIEALKHYTESLGWILLEINSKGEIVCVTENIRELIQLDRIDLYKKSIFSLVHVNDQDKLKPLLRDIQSFAWSSGDSDKFQAIQAKLLIKNSDEEDRSGYVEAVIHAAPVRGSSAEEAGSVMCVIRRCEDASAALLPIDGGPPAITAKHSDHIVFRLDCNYTILSCDLSGVDNCINSPVSLVGTHYLELVESCDRGRVVSHLQQAACYPAPPAISVPFRIHIATDTRPSLRVSARSRLFPAKPGESDFIMSTHTILGDEDLNILEADAPRPPVGGPLMTSVANGESSSCETRFRSPMSPGEHSFTLNDFEFEPWTSTYPLGEMSGDDSKDRKDTSSEAPHTPQTPRAPPTPGEGPPTVAGEEPNRLRSLLSKKPGTDGGLNSNNRILKDLLKQEDEEATGSETSAPHTPLTPHTPHTPHTPAAAMSPLHTAPAHPRPSPHAPHAPHAPHPQHQPHTSHASTGPHSLPQSHNSDVLLRILNDKSDEDAEERRNTDGGRNTSQPSALLSQLLSSSNGPSGNGRSQDSDNYLLSGVKRKLEDKGMAGNIKRATPENQQQVTSSAVSASSTPSSTAVNSATTSSSGMSPLCQKNQILVSLLARQQTTPTTPLPLPNPNLRAYGPTARCRPPPPQMPQMPPQRHHHSTLSTILTGPAHGSSRASNVNGGPGAVSSAAGTDASTVTMQSSQSHLQMVLQGARGPYAPPPTPTPLHYGNTAPHHVYNNQPSVSSRAQGGSGGGDSEVPSDQTLSDILDEVIDHMPDADRPQPDVNVLMDLENSRQIRPDYAGNKEKNAMINAIRQSLMQCETVTKSPVSSSPGAPPVYAVQSPSSCNMGSSGAMYSSGDRARAALILTEQHARLMAAQREQQMLVSPEAAEQPQADLVSALVSGTAPNVALTRTDYHHLSLYPSNQMGSNYGTNKITSSQQNPMLSRQLSQGSGGYAHGTGVGVAHSAAALHTPPQPPYHRAPRPHLVGGYYSEGGAGGYCGEYGRRTPLPPHAAHAAHAPHLAPIAHPHPHHDPPLPCAGNSSVVGGAGVGGANAAGGTSEYVRNELRAVVGARSARPDMQPPMQPSDLDPLMTFDMPTTGGGGVVGGRAASASANTWDSQQTTPSTTEAGTAEAVAAAAAGDEAAAAAAAAAAGAAAKASLLQKLLSQ